MTIMIYYLEDAAFSSTRVLSKLRAELGEKIHIDQFPKRQQLEAALIQDVPDIVIVDLLVPEKYKFAFRIAFGQSWFWRVLGARLGLRAVVLRWGRKKLPKYLRGLEGVLDLGGQTYWAGFDFLRSRALGVQSWPKKKPLCLVYSACLNEEFIEHIGPFGEICKKLRDHVKRDAARMGIDDQFTKGYIAKHESRLKLRGDELKQLVRRVADFVEKNVPPVN